MATVTEVERDAELRRLAARLLDRAWQGAAGYCVPNRRSYPHLWLWDSCFHVIAWAALGDRRAVEELQTVFAGQFAGGFLPHIRYRDGSIRHRHRGPLAGSSSFTQPPVYVRALLAVRDAGMEIPAELLDRAASALDALWRDRLRDGLLVVVHPWEAGTDDSPRWDSWVGSHRWRRRRWTAFDREIASRAVYGADGQAIDSTAFVVAPASFNAIAADAARCLGDLLDDDTWRRRAGDLADTLDARAWDADQGLWWDVPVVGGGESCRTPTVDGVLPALCTANREHASTALDQLIDPARFHAPFGPRFLPKDHPWYRPRRYWRGPAWPPINFYLWLAALRQGRRELARDLAERTKAAVLRARFSEYWDPETGRGLGARPQTWSAVAVALGAAFTAESPGG